MKRLISLVLLTGSLPLVGDDLSVTNEATNTVVTVSTDPLLQEDTLESKAQKLAKELEETTAIEKRAREILAEKKAKETWEAMTQKEKQNFIGEEATRRAFEKLGVNKVRQWNKRVQELDSQGLSLSREERKESEEALVYSLQNQDKTGPEIGHQIDALCAPGAAIQALKELELKHLSVPTERTVAGPENQRVVMGSTKAEVDALLKDWNSRKSNRATPNRPMYYYTKDVSLIVDFKNDMAIGVYVIDRPGAGVTSISQTRFNELVKLIGQKPKLANIKEDSSGIHEFGVGDHDD